MIGGTFCFLVSKVLNSEPSHLIEQDLLHIWAEIVFADSANFDLSTLSPCRRLKTNFLYYVEEYTWAHVRSRLSKHLCIE